MSFVEPGSSIQSSVLPSSPGHPLTKFPNQSLDDQPGFKDSPMPILLLNNNPGILEVNQMAFLNDQHFYLVCFLDFLDQIL